MTSSHSPLSSLSREPEECPNTENHICFSQSWRSVLPQLVFALVVSSFVVGLSMATELYGIPVTAFDRSFTLPLAPLVFAVMVARPLVLLKDGYHELRCTELRSISGRLSKEQIRIDIPYEDIKGVRVRQTITQRLFNVGDILAWTAAAAHPEVTMKGVANPNHYSAIITHRLRLAQNKSSERNDFSLSHPEGKA